MADAATSFAQGVELQGNLMNRIAEANRSKQLQEQAQALLPLRLQGMELENEAGRLNLATIAHNNTVQAARLRDEGKLTAAMAALATGNDPGQIQFETSDASKLFMEARSKSAIGMQVATKLEQFNRMLADPLLRGEDVSEIMNMKMGQGGVPTPEAFRRLSQLHNAAVTKAAEAKRAEEEFKSNLDAKRQQENLRISGQNRLEVANAKADQAHVGATGKVDPVKMASFRRQLDIIKNDKNLSSEAKAAKIDEATRQFQATEAGTVPAAPQLSQDVLDEIGVNNGQVKTLLEQKAELLARKARGDTGKSWYGTGTPIDDQIKTIDAQVKALRDANSKLRNPAPEATPAAVAPQPQASAPAQVPSGVALVVKRDGSVVKPPRPAPANQQQQPAASSGEMQGPPAPADNVAKQMLPENPTAEVSRLIDAGQKSKDAVAAAFWEIVADKLGVQPEPVGASRVARKPRTVAKNDPRIRKYYEGLPDETKQRILSEVLQRTKQNPDAFIPALFDYMITK